MEKKQSSVEWLAGNLDKYIESGNQIAVYALVEQARAIHEEEHTKAYIEGGKSIMHGVVSSPEGLIAKAEIYYNETFKTK